MTTSETEPFTRITNLYEGICTLHTPIEGKNHRSRADFLPLITLERRSKCGNTHSEHHSYGCSRTENHAENDSPFFANSSLEVIGRFSS